MGRAWLEAERIGERIRFIRARLWAVLPWFGRPVSAANKSGNDTAEPRSGLTCLRTLFVAYLLAVALLVVVAGPVSATGGGEDPMVVTAEVSGSLGVVSTAQSGTGNDPESDTERRLVDRETSERVDGVVIALWSIAAGMTVMLVLFLWHTSPRRRLRLARRRSTQLYDGEADRAEAGAEAPSATDAEDDPVVEDAEAAAAATRDDAEAVAVAASGAMEGPELPPVWEDEAEPDGQEAEPAEDSPAKQSAAAGAVADEGRPGLWMRLRRMLGLD